MNEGLTGNAFTRSIASSSVPLAFGLAGFSKPMWLSLICRKVKPFCSAARPSHAFQYLAAAGAVVVIVVLPGHVQSPCGLTASED
jgi:hypothetical protein